MLINLSTVQPSAKSRDKLLLIFSQARYVFLFGVRSKVTTNDKMRMTALRRATTSKILTLRNRGRKFDHSTTHSRKTSDSLRGNTNLGNTMAFLRLFLSICAENWNSDVCTGEWGLRIVIFRSLPPGLVSENTLDGGGRLKCCGIFLSRPVLANRPRLTSAFKLSSRWRFSLLFVIILHTSRADDDVRKLR